MGLFETHVPIHDQGDDALVAMEVGELVTDYEGALLSTGTADAMLLSELLADHDRIIRSPSTEGHQSGARGLGNFRGLHDRRSRHLLPVEGIVAQSVHLGPGHERSPRTSDSVGIPRFDGAIGTHHRVLGQIPHDALVGGTAGHHRVEVPIRGHDVVAVLAGQHRHIPTAGQVPGVEMVVIGRVGPVALGTVLGVDRRSGLDLVGVADPLGLGLNDGGGPRVQLTSDLTGGLVELIGARTFDEVHRMLGAIQLRVHRVQRAGLTRLRSTRDHVASDLVLDLLTHELLVPAQTRAFLYRGRCLARGLGRDPGLITRDDERVLPAGEGGDDLPMIPDVENLADLTGDGGRLTVAPHLLGAPADDPVLVDLDRALRPGPVAFNGGTHDLAHLLDERAAVLVDLDCCLGIEAH